MPVWKFVPAETGDQTALEDVSLDLGAYYQSIENIATYLRAHDGIEVEDLLSFLAAYYESLEDIGSDLSAYYQAVEDAVALLQTCTYSLEDVRPSLQAAALVFENLKTDLTALGNAREDLITSFYVAGYARHDLSTYLAAVIPLVLSDLGVYFEATDGTALSSVRTYLAAVKRAPSFRSVMAQRVSSVMQEV